MSTFRADFKFCGCFNGKDIAASKWLKKLDWELEGYAVNGVIPSHRYIQAIDLLLTEDASAWAETNPQAIHLLSTDEPDAVTVRAFRGLLCERFPSKSSEISNTTFEAELTELKQQDESLSAYYKRVTSMMQRVGAKDRALPGAIPITPLESAMLDTIMRAFLKGLSDPDVRREATRGLASIDKSLRGVYALAEESRLTKLEVSKLVAEDFKSQELEMLRSVVQKTIPKSQFDSMVSAYQAKANPNQAWEAAMRAAGPQQMLVQQAYHDRYGDRPDPPRTELPKTEAYTQKTEPYIAQNPIRRNGAGADYRESVLQKASYTGKTYRPQQQQRELPDRSSSKNPFVNGSRSWSMKADGPLCVRGGCLGKKSNDGHECTPLPAWEQSYLREAVFGSSPQVNFAAASYGEHDGAAVAWNWPSSSQSSSRGLTPTSSTASSVHSITAGMSGLMRQASSQGPAAEAFSNKSSVEVHYGEGSGTGKRPAEEDPSQQRPAPQDRQPQYVDAVQQPSIAIQKPLPYSVPQQPAAAASHPPMQNAGLPQQPQAQYPMMFGAMPPQVPTSMPSQPAAATDDTAMEERPKRKGKRKVGKKTELQPLVGMFNDSSAKFDTPVSIRQVLQHNKIDMTWLDLLCWSPAMCKELKRLCTRVPKKRARKPSAATSQQQPAIVPQFPVFQPQFVSQPPIGSQFSTQTVQGQNQPPFFGPTVSQVIAQPDSHTRFLQTLAGTEKAFRISGTARVGDTETGLLKQNTQADQGSDMNVMSTPLVQQLQLSLRSLAEVGFMGLCMETADHRETMLQHWVMFDFCCEGLWRTVRCFVNPNIPGVPDSPRLLLGLPWLYDINAVISIRGSSIQIGDPLVGETPRFVTGPEMVYHRDHSLLMYPKAIIQAPGKIVEEAEADDEDSSDSSEDSLSGIDEPHKQGFR